MFGGGRGRGLEVASNVIRGGGGSEDGLGRLNRSMWPCKNCDICLVKQGIIVWSKWQNLEQESDILWRQGQKQREQIQQVRGDGGLHQWFCLDSELVLKECAGSGDIDSIIFR